MKSARFKHTLTIVIWSLVLVLAIGLAVLFSSGFHWTRNPFSWPSKEEMAVVKELTISEAVTDLRVQWLSGSVTVYPSEDEAIHIIQKAIPEIADKDLFSVRQEGERLQVQDNRSRFGISFFAFLPESAPSYLELYLPPQQYQRMECQSASSDFILSGYALNANTLLLSSASGDFFFTGRFETVEANTTSGDICAAEISSQTLSCSSTSGEVNIQHAKAKELKASTVSGDILLEQATGKTSVNLSTTSGEITGGQLSCGELLASSVSGDISLSGSFSAVNGNTTSGELSFTDTQTPEHLSCSSVSGSIWITLPEHKGFTLFFDTTSGEWSSDFQIQKKDDRLVYGDGNREYRIDTVSGDCYLKALK
ncbi:MAG: DUF4097 family beta strand repeat protein [Clostridiales bacterium]|nr:DUF4097 family beta strand repeat protein [Clostridiales bacterium]